MNPRIYYQDDDITLWHGDCRDVYPLLADSSIDMIFADPPYGHNNNNGDLIHRWEAALGRGKQQESRPIAHDGADADDLFRESLPAWKRLLRSGCCCCCCCGGGGPDPQFARWAMWLDENMSFKQMIVWDKGKMGMGWHYRRSYETVLVAQRDRGKTNWYDTSKKIENVIRPGDYGIRKIIPKASDHPTPKPVELPAHFIGLHTRPGDLVLDPFAGGGSTAVACLRTGRRFVGIELDERWCEMTVERIKQERAKSALPQPTLEPSA